MYMSETDEIRYGHQINFQFSFPPKIREFAPFFKTILQNKKDRRENWNYSNRKKCLYFYDKLLSNQSIINTFSYCSFAIHVK